MPKRLVSKGRDVKIHSAGPPESRWMMDSMLRKHECDGKMFVIY